MADDNRAGRWLCAVASAAVLMVCAAIAATASAQDAGLKISSDAARSIDLRTAPEVPAVPRPPGLVTSRPTIPMADYVAAKNAAAARAPGQAKPAMAAPPVSSNVTLYTQVGSTNESQTTGGNRFPPGGDIATSANWMVQVNNDVVTTLNWFTNAFAQRKLSTFFSNSDDFIFDFGGCDSYPADYADVPGSLSGPYLVRCWKEPTARKAFADGDMKVDAIRSAGDNPRGIQETTTARDEEARAGQQPSVFETAGL